ncbi:methionine ABC transporter ATP-binding protein [Pantoea sp. 1.19]|uniref:methionine ABC transporter ATP-binding protein n=1 Tax=Pantoea sp. 1.19 TaxID=1925589 RepID=UPI000948A5FB|nr:ATP-binding cassette domain-containing protein [Pantoea sp. 1.19]
MIEIENLTRRYGDGPAALESVTLSIPRGAMFGILGRSGAGKSTLLRCLNLLERPSSGRIRVEGQDLTQLTPPQLRQQRQQMGMIFQHVNLLHSRNVADNVALPLAIAGVPRAARRARVADLLALVGLSDRSQAWPSQLSGGQQQRVGIARALAVAPRYLLCDEATSALDPESTGAILDLLATVRRELQLTVVLITHEMAVVKRICDGAALLEQGRLVESGTLDSIMARKAGRLRQMLLQDGETDRAFVARYAAGGSTRCVA